MASPSVAEILPLAAELPRSVPLRPILDTRRGLDQAGDDPEDVNIVFIIRLSLPLNGFRRIIVDQTTDTHHRDRPVDCLTSRVSPR